MKVIDKEKLQKNWKVKALNSPYNTVIISKDKAYFYKTELKTFKQIIEASNNKVKEGEEYTLVFTKWKIETRKCIKGEGFEVPVSYEEETK